MTEKQFWAAIEKTLGTELDATLDEHGKTMKRLTSLLISKAGDLRDADGKQRVVLLQQIFKKAGYNALWNRIQSAFDTLLENQNKIWTDNTTVSGRLTRSTSRLAGFEKVNFEKFGQLGHGAVEELSKKFTQAVKENWTTQELKQNIEGISGKVTYYSDSISQTAVRGFDRAVTDEKARIGDVEQALYDGPPTIETSHQFCIDNLGLTFTRDEIDGLENGQLEPVSVYCGGYRCRHRWRWLIQDVLK